MYLFIDPSLMSTIRLVLLSGTISREHVFEVSNRELLNVIKEALERENIVLTDLEGIVVLIGEGRFSNTRIASVVGNTLSYALNIPVVATTRGHEPTQSTVHTFFSPSNITMYITPTYSGEPHIGIPTQF